MRRWAALAAVFPVVTAGLVVAVLTRASGSAAQASILRGVLAQVRANFGDNRLVRAEIDGSTLHVVVSDAAEPLKGEFEALVLAAAVADRMSSHGQKPIAAVQYADRRGHVLSGISYRERSTGGLVNLDGEEVPRIHGTDPSSLRLETCKSVGDAIRGYQPPLTLTSVKWLPYLHGTCVFHLRISPPYLVDALAYAGEHAQGVISRTINDPPNGFWKQDHAFFVELDGAHGGPLMSIAEVPARTHQLRWLTQSLGRR